MKWDIDSVGGAWSARKDVMKFEVLRWEESSVSSFMVAVVAVVVRGELGVSAGSERVRGDLSAGTIGRIDLAVCSWP